MDRMPYLIARSIFSSMFIFTTAILSGNSSAIASSAGAIARQGPHHGAQKSTRTGLLLLRTSEANLAALDACAFMRIITWM